MPILRIWGVAARSGSAGSSRALGGDLPLADAAVSRCAEFAADRSAADHTLARSWPPLSGPWLSHRAPPQDGPGGVGIPPGCRPTDQRASDGTSRIGDDRLAALRRRDPSSSSCLRWLG